MRTGDAGSVGVRGPVTPATVGGSVVQRVVSRRSQIRMTEDEVHEFLSGHRTAQVATVDGVGMPHLVAMWYGLIDGEVVMWTYAKSQKARNLRRSPKIAVLVESGERYEELRGVSLTGEAEVSEDREYVMRVGEAVLFGSRAGDELDPAAGDILERTGAKRIAITVKPTKVASWDHRKLGGRH
jgi:PPOX class probable F420-dependent enzyme